MLFYGIERKRNINKGRKHSSEKSVREPCLPWSPEQYLMVSFISLLRLLFLLVVLGLSPFILYSFLKTSASHYAIDSKSVDYEIFCC